MNQEKYSAGIKMSSFHEKLVYVIDDNGADFKFVKRALKEMGFNEIKHITNGDEALRVLKQTDKLPDLIYLDIEMRDDGINGITVVHSIKTDKNLKKIPVVVMSGNTSLLKESEDLADGTFWKGDFFNLVAKTKEMAIKLVS